MIVLVASLVMPYLLCCIFSSQSICEISEYKISKCIQQQRHVNSIPQGQICFEACMNISIFFETLLSSNLNVPRIYID